MSNDWQDFCIFCGRWSKIQNYPTWTVSSSKFAERCTDPNGIFRICFYSKLGGTMTCAERGVWSWFFLHLWVTDRSKFKIGLHERYVAPNLQKCVLILIQFSESVSNRNWRYFWMCASRAVWSYFFLYFWVTDRPKFKIDLYGRYVAHNLQKCVVTVYWS